MGVKSQVVNQYLTYHNRNGFLSPRWWGHTNQFYYAKSLMLIISNTEVGAMKPGQLSREEP